MKTKRLITLTFAAFTVICLQAQSFVVFKESKIYQGVKKVEVESTFATVKVVGSDRSDIEFTGEILSNSQDKVLKIDHFKDGDELSIKVESSMFKTGRFSGTITLLVPKAMHLDISSGSGDVLISNIIDNESEIETGSGAIHIYAFSGSAEIDSGSGEVKLGDCKSDMDVETASGEINVTNHEGRLDLDAASGAIKGSKITGKVSASTASGEINFVDISSVTSSLSFSSASGSIQLKNVRADLKVSAVSGSIDMIDIIGTLDVSTVSGSSNGTNIKITRDSFFKSVSGSINFDLANDNSELSYTLNSVSGSLSTPEASGRGNLIVKKGAILVTGESVSGSQEYK